MLRRHSSSRQRLVLLTERPFLRISVINHLRKTIDEWTVVHVNRIPHSISLLASLLSISIWWRVDVGIGRWE